MEEKILFGNQLFPNVPVSPKDALFGIIGTNSMNANVAWPVSTETLSKHILMLGAIGTGKTNALNCLLNSIRSTMGRNELCKDGWKRRHIIALFTDADAHPLGFCKSAKNYPKAGMPADFGELSAMWGDDENAGEMDYQAKRLLLFAPNTTFWKTISSCWENVVIRTAQEATGLQDISYQVMLDTIVNSVG